MKSKILSIVFAVLLILIFYSSAMAITALYKQIAGIGNTDFVDEVIVTELRVASPTKVQVIVKSKSSTVANVVYTVNLYLDGAKSGTSTISWTSGQIPDTEKTINFSGLSLGAVTSIGVEVTR